jgi:NAD(P) transhydrogenase subunit alpha
MRIGIPKEIMANERRVAATPETVAAYVEAGWEVEVERGAGEGIFVSDEAYAQAGAKLSSDLDGLYARAQVVLKVKQPCPHRALRVHEAELLRPGTVLVTFLHPATPSHHGMVELLRKGRVTAFTMDGVPRTSRAQAMDGLTSMSTVTGYKSVLLAACRLPGFVPMVGTAIGALGPAKALIVGAGVVGLQAIATAKRLGAAVSAVDIRREAREQARSLGAKDVGFELPDEVAHGEGGYARALPADWLEQERAVLAPLVAAADLVVLSALVPGEVAPTLVTEEMVARMKPGSVIVDVSVDQGGNCAAVRPGEETVCHGVTIVGTQNIPGSVAVDATRLYARNMLNFTKNLFKQGPGKVDWDDDIVQACLVTHEGTIHHAGTLKAMNR